MVVVAIIGLLAAIAIPNIRGAIEKAQKQACAVNRKNIDGAKLQWSVENHQPATATPTDADLFGENAAGQRVVTGPLEEVAGHPQILDPTRGLSVPLRQPERADEPGISRDG